MDKLTRYREIIEEIFRENASIPFAHGDLTIQPLFDHTKDHYALLVFGMEGDQWVHFCIAHVDIADTKFVIQWDSGEYSIAQELFDRGVPDEDMVQAFRPYLQQYKRLEDKQKQEKQLAGVS